MDAQIRLKHLSGLSLEEPELISFSFVKDAYTPYTTLRARLHGVQADYETITEIFLYVGEHLVHHGLVDKLDISDSDGMKLVTLSSRGFTSLLCQNQITPGLVSDITINDLMDSYYQLPYVTHEDNPDQSSYIYVKDSSTMWDGIANLAFKLNGIYPYIRGTNCVRTSAEQNPKAFVYDNSSIIESGMGYDYVNMISHFDMSDINGEYGEFTLSDSDVRTCMIERHRVFELDMQFLYDPQQALEYRSNYSKRGCRRYFCRYCGYNGEDLCDLVSFGNISSKRIGKIEISGNNSGIFTSLSVYYDGFFNQGTL